MLAFMRRALLRHDMILAVNGAEDERNQRNLAIVARQFSTKFFPLLVLAHRRFLAHFNLVSPSLSTPNSYKHSGRAPHRHARLGRHLRHVLLLPRDGRLGPLGTLKSFEKRKSEEERVIFVEKETAEFLPALFLRIFE